MPPVLGCVALAVLLAATAEAGDARAGECLSRLRTAPAAFERCRGPNATLCMLFIPEEPFSIMPTALVAQDNQTLFRCKDRARFAPGLRGVWFDVQDKISALDDALCVFAGSNCTFDGMIDLASDNKTIEAGYRLGVGGLAFLLPHRVRPTLRPLVAILGGRFVLVGPRTALHPRRDALLILTAPFERVAWLSILAVAVLLLLLWLAAVWRTSHSVTLSALARAVVGEPEDRPLPPPERPQDRPEHGEYVQAMHLSHNISLVTVRFSIKAFLAVTIIFYEIAVVYHVVDNMNAPNTVQIENMSKERLSRVALVHGGATEKVFRKTVDPGQAYDNGEPPWQKCWPIEECFNMVLNKTAGLVVTYDFAVRFFLEKMGACDKLAVYKTRYEGASFTGTWYVNSNVADELRIRVNKRLIELAMDNEIKKLTRDIAEPSTTTCGAQTGTKIVVEILGLLFVFILSPLVLVAVLCLLYGMVMQRLAMRLSRGRV